MTEPFVLELLPARGLDQSMLLPVLIGLIIVLISTETLGWVFAGAVVPGYLASVLVIQPVTGAIVIFESLVTLGISAALAKALSRTDAWTRFFGRERFFLILMVSLIVRMHDHAWFAPWAITQLDLLFETRLETQQEFYSVGLVLVPLTANMLWKPALPRGMMQLGVQVGLTYLVLALVLLPHTNLSLSSIELTYEHSAINFVGHAKAHIILLSAALLAAQFNLTYGWDFNGILVPALLALLWLTPLKLVATLGEAVIVFYLTKGFLALPGIRHLDFEGPRKIVVVFTLAFLWKVALGFSLPSFWPYFKVSDAYGFGYLLSSLLAVKMLGVKSVRAVLLPSLLASAGGFVIGSALGFLLDLGFPSPPPEDRPSQPASSRLATTPLGVMTLARMDVARVREPLAPPSSAEIGRLRDFWSTAAALDLEPGESPQAALELLRGQIGDLGLQVVPLGTFAMGLEVEGEVDARPRRQWLAVVADGSDRQRGFAWGLVVPGAEGPVLVVPLPMSEAPAAEAAAIACRRIDCRAVIVAGRELRRPGTRVRPRALELAMQAFADVTDGYAVIRGDRMDPSAGALIHQLRGSIPLNLWPKYEPTWEPYETMIRLPTGESDVVVLRASVLSYEQFVGEHGRELQPELDAALEAAERARGQSGLDPDQLLAVLSEIYEQREPTGTWGATYHAPSKAELLALEQLVVDPLLWWAERGGSARPPASLVVRAAELDYELVELGDCGQPRPDKCMVLLRERNGESTSGWGTLVVRRSAGVTAHVVEVPHPHRERETWEIGAEMWQLLEGRALLIAGADGLPLDPRGDRGELVRNRNPDPVRHGNLDTPFHAIHQALTRSMRGSVGAEVVQIRGLAAYRQIPRDVILGLGLPEAGDLVEDACWGTLAPDLARLVARWGSCQIANGSESLYLLTGAGTPQLEYTREFGFGTRVVVLWLSASLRERYVAPRSVRRSGVVRGLEQAGLDVRLQGELDATPIWSKQPAAAGSPRRTAYGLDGFERTIADAVAYAETGNLHLLRTLADTEARAADLRISAAIGRDYGQPILVIEYIAPASGPSRVGRRAIVFLSPELSGRSQLAFTEIERGIRALRVRALARPQVMVVTEVPIAGSDGGAQ